MRAPAITDPAHRASAALLAVVVLGLAGLAGVWSVRPPSARPASAPAGEFSAGRAFQQVEAIATRPHPVGSAAQDQVREHLLTTLRGLGLSPEVQDTVSIEGAGLSSSAGGAGLARVRNVIAIIPGTGSTGGSTGSGSGGSGGIFGVGLGEGVSKIFYLPEAPTDMMLANIGEELGLVGVSAVLLAYLLFAYAATSGNLAVVGVLGSLYPVATVVLARWLLGERLSGGQNAGVALALTGVGLLAAA